MNFAHLHLVLNHIPVIGIPVALSFLIFGLWAKNAPTQRFSLLILFGLAAMVVPVYLTGEPAEEVVEHLPGVMESLIEAHEEAAEVSLIMTLLSGVFAFVALWFQRNELIREWINLSVMCVASVALISLVYTANLGGKIRHSELRSGASAQLSAEPIHEKGSDDD